MENVIEHLPKDCVLPLLRGRIADLSAVEAALSKRLSRAPAGVLNVSPHRGGFQYFRATAKTGRKGEYIPEEKMSLAAAIAQRDYDAKILAEIQRLRWVLEKCVEKYNVSIAENLYAQLHPARRSLVTPLVYPDEDFVERWSAVKYAGRDFDADGPVLMTARGERVRSKSEIIIADALFRRGIPYRYEYPHELLAGAARGVEDSHAAGDHVGGARAGRRGGGGVLAGRRGAGGRGDLRARGCKRVVVYPDFTCLNVRTHQEFVWEHFGMIDVPEYCQNMASKMDMYLQNGFCMGKNFVMTTETHDRPLNSMMVEKMLEQLV
ncbi:hypothetical protein SAMN05720781_2710 [Fibrobacter sp. UWT3]|uniref:hypothetical protein n=1 Tax=Fibrobacter sp. UWT3 TaxID=1896225 RepID=UPI000BDC1451|nr:hypothetical protein [Fibrobacter sp. UWT3]SOE78781.1 hypothetical protein SAMN05720781_2710 [Fibrobacter sp. UWT3]